MKINLDPRKTNALERIAAALEGIESLLTVGVAVRMGIVTAASDYRDSSTDSSPLPDSPKKPRGGKSKA